MEEKREGNSIDLGVISLFGALENYVIFLPIVFLTISVVYIFLNFNFLHTYEYYLVFSRKFIFLNATHTILTIVYMFLFLEGKNFIKRFWANKKSKVYMLLFVLYLCLSYPMIMFLQNNYIKFFLLLLPNFFYFRHNVKQIMGISLLYSLKAKTILNNETLNNLKTITKRERQLMTILTSLIVATLLFLAYPSPPDSNVIVIFLILQVLIISILFWHILKNKGKIWRNKKLYLLRLYLLPLSLVSPLAVVGCGAAHGTEYFALLHKMSQKSKTRFLLSPIVILIGASTIWGILMLFTVDIGIVPNIFLEKNYQDEPNKFFGFIFFLNANFHYFMDSFLFRTSGDPLNESKELLL